MQKKPAERLAILEVCTGMPSKPDSIVGSNMQILKYKGARQCMRCKRMQTWSTNEQKCMRKTQETLIQ